MNLNEQLKQDAEKYNLGSGAGGSDYYNIEEGNDNVVRVLTTGEVYATHFLGKGTKSPICYGVEKGCPIRDDEGNHPTPSSVRYALYVLDRKDNEVKLAMFPYSVMRGIADLQENPDFQFDEFPMPYDIRITYRPDEAPANKYKVDAVPRIEPISEEVQEQLNEKLRDITPTDFVEKMKEKQITKHKEAGIWKSPEDLRKEFEEGVEKFSKNIENKNVKENSQKTQQNQRVEYRTPEEEGINPDDIPW